MKIIFPNSEYNIDSDLGCDLLKELFIKKDNDVVNLNMFEDVFSSIYNNTEFDYKTDSDINYIINGLNYFGSDRIWEFILEIRNKVYYEEKQHVQNKYIELLGKKKSFWKYCCQNPLIPTELFEKNKDKIIWGSLCRNLNISLDFLKANENKINWKMLSTNSSIPMSFFNKNIDKFEVKSWDFLSSNSSISVDFLLENRHKISWKYLMINPSIPEDFFRENIEKIHWAGLCQNKNIPIDLIEENLDKKNRIFSWCSLSENPSVPINFFEKHKDKIMLNCLLRNPSIPLEFIFNNFVFTKLRWEMFKYNHNMTIEFLKEHIGEIYWDALTQNTSIPIEFFIENKKILMEALSENTSIPIEFFIENKHMINNSVIRINLFENNFSIYIKNRVDDRLRRINPILADVYIQNNIVAQYCLNILSNNITDRQLKLLYDYSPLLRNTISDSEDRKYFYMQIKNILCGLKNITKYKDEIKQICSYKKHLLTIYDIKNLNDSDIIQINKNDKIITIKKKDNKFIVNDNNIHYRVDESDLYKYIGSKYEIKSISNDEEKISLTKELDYRKNIVLKDIYKRMQSTIPKLTFKEFYEFYMLTYNRDPLSITEKDIDSMFSRLEKYIQIKRIEYERKIRNIKPEEEKKIPINMEMYNLLSIRDLNMTIDEFNNAYNLVVDLFTEDMTIDDQLNLIYNHIIEIRNTEIN